MMAVSDNKTTKPKSPTNKLEIIMAVGIFIIFGILLFLSHNIAYNRALKSLEIVAENNARLHLSVLQSELDKQRTIPIILSDDELVIKALNSKNNNDELSQKLENLKEKTGASVIYILNDKGIGVAASNWRLPTSFVGEDYSFRDYYKLALKNGRAEQFALGSVSHKPGLYFSNAIEHRGKIIGVTIIKIEFDNIETLWDGMNDSAYIINKDNAILISNNSDMRFSPLPAITSNEFATSLKVPVSDWKLVQISSKINAQRAGIIALGICLLFEIIISLFLLWLRNNRIQILREREWDKNYRNDLEHNVAQRTAELSQEIKERKDAEARLRDMQSDLVQANKLATLGQITAGVAHEINQPLATIQILAENAIKLEDMGDKKPANMVSENLNNIIRMSERIGKITNELRNFSRKAQGTNETATIAEIIESSLLLASSRIRQNQVKLNVAPIKSEWQISGEKVRLEQIIVNLLQNAFEALEGINNPQIDIDFVETANDITIKIIDNGNGIDEKIKDNLFTPFRTTKQKGVGLGLSISSDIARDFDAKLYLDENRDKTIFCLKLNRVS